MSKRFRIGCIDGLGPSVFLLAISLWPACIHSQELSSALKKLPKEFSKQVERVGKALDVYEKQELALVTRYCELLDQSAKSLRFDSSAHPALVATSLSEIDSTRKWLSDGGNLPDCSQTIGVVFDFAIDVSKKRNEFSRHVNRLAAALNRKGLIAQSAEIVRLAAKTGGRFEGKSPIRAETVYRGYRVHGADLKNLQIRIGKLEGSEFSGSVERDWNFSGHPVHSLSGRIEGICIVAQTGDTLQFGNNLDNLWTYNGVVIGDAIVGRYFGTTRKGTPGGGVFRVELK